jgi:hypothetical protein
MFFLLRSAFWLGLTFSAMEWPSDGLSPSAASELAAQAAAHATRLCAENARECVEAARAARAIGAKAPAAKSTPAARASAADTLDRADRAAPWKGRG